MKKYITTVWVFAAILTYGFSVGISKADAQIFSRPPLELSQILTENKTPEAIARYMWRNFAYETDQQQFGEAEYWQSTDEFLKNGRGDCEDFALFASEMLNKQGIKALVLNIYGSRFAHTICVFEENGTYHAIDGTDIKRVGAKDLPALISEIYPQWNKGAIVTRAKDSQKGRILKKFEKHAKAARAFASSL